MPRAFFLILLFLSLFNPLVAETGINMEVGVLRGQVFHKTAGDHLYSLLPGNNLLATGAEVITSGDGLVFLKPDQETEFRLREDTALAVSGAASFELRKGIAGISAASSTVTLVTPHARMTLSACLAVVKVNPQLTRICVVRGKVLVSRGNSLEEISLPSGFELAAATGRISQPYPYTEELRYTWYWTTPEKEPSLQ